MRTYSKHDYSQVCEWYGARHQSPPPIECTPETGVIVDGVAAGFLLKTDAKVGILEFFITNKDAEKELRHRAMTDIAHALTLTAKNLGLKQIVCNTEFDNVKRLLHLSNFTYYGEFSTFSKEL